MNCPVCDGRMREIQKGGVDIDVCPDCKGIWLDRGELEKIVAVASQERSEPGRPDSEQNQRQQAEPSTRGLEREDRHHDDDERDKGHERHSHGTEQKRKGSFLQDLLGGLGGE